MNERDTPRAIRLHTDDNVAILLDDGMPGAVEVLGERVAHDVELVEGIARGHKAAVRAIAIGQPVMKYGVVIGLATADIAAGAWVHMHNCRSQFDQRSQTLDRHTGAPTDTRYE